jgi:hypothetical protein
MPDTVRRVGLIRVGGRLGDLAQAGGPGHAAVQARTTQVRLAAGARRR